MRNGSLLTAGRLVMVGKTTMVSSSVRNVVSGQDIAAKVEGHTNGGK